MEKGQYCALKYVFNVDRKLRYHQCSSESQELSTRYLRPSSLVCSSRVVTWSLYGVSVT